MISPSLTQRNLWGGEGGGSLIRKLTVVGVELCQKVQRRIQGVGGRPLTAECDLFTRRSAHSFLG